MIKHESQSDQAFEKKCARIFAKKSHLLNMIGPKRATTKQELWLKNCPTLNKYD